MMNDHTIISQFIKQQDINFPLQKITELSLKDALCLISLIRSSSAITNDGHVGPITSVQPFVPGGLHNSETNCFCHLIDRNLITISKYTDTSIFNVVNNEIQDFDLKAVKWKIHLENFEATVLQLNGILSSSNWPLTWQYDVKTVWLEISVLECIEYLEYLASERDLDIEITDNIQNIFLTLLRNNSVSQCFSLMHDAVCEASDNFFRNIISIEDIGNNFIQCIFKNTNKTHWYKEENRPIYIPQSQLSYVFHYEFLKIGEAGFKAIPHDMSEENLRCEANQILFCGNPHGCLANIISPRTPVSTRGDCPTG